MYIYFSFGTDMSQVLLCEFICTVFQFQHFVVRTVMNPNKPIRLKIISMGDAEVGKVSNAVINLCLNFRLTENGFRNGADKHHTKTKTYSSIAVTHFDVVCRCFK